MQCNYVTPWERQEAGHGSHLFLHFVSGFLIIISMFTGLNFPYPEMFQDQNMKHDFCSYWTWPEKSISCFHTSANWNSLRCPVLIFPGIHARNVIKTKCDPKRASEMTKRLKQFWWKTAPFLLRYALNKSFRTLPWPMWSCNSPISNFLIQFPLQRTNNSIFDGPKINNTPISIFLSVKWD